VIASLAGTKAECPRGAHRANLSWWPWSAADRTLKLTWRSVATLLRVHAAECQPVRRTQASSVHVSRLGRSHALGCKGATPRSGAAHAHSVEDIELRRERGEVLVT
jgi:hypothetical protein